MLDDIARYVGQRVVAVVAETEAAAEEGCRRVEGGYEVLPAVFDADEATPPPAPARRCSPPSADRELVFDRQEVLPGVAASSPTCAARQSWVSLHIDGRTDWAEGVGLARQTHRQVSLKRKLKALDSGA